MSFIQFVCQCNSRYVGRISQSLQERIKQHISGSIRNYHYSQDRCNISRVCKTIRTSQIIARNSAIGQHLLKTPSCRYSQYSDTKFSMLGRAHDYTSLHLSALEDTFIKSFPPNLCRHKEFLYNLKQSLTLFSFTSDWLPLLTNQTHSRFLFLYLIGCLFLTNQTSSPFLRKHDWIAFSLY